MSFFKKRALKRELDQIVSAEAVEQILANTSEKSALTRGRIEFVVVFVRGELPAEALANVQLVAGIALARGAIIHDFIGQLVVIAFGTHPRSPAKPGSRLSLVEGLSRQLGEKIKIVHGAAEGYYGLIGSKEQMSYSFLVPCFDAVLGTLNHLQFGQVEEFRETNSA